MAKTEKRARERTVSSSYFLGCFGLSRKIYSDKAMDAAEEGGEMKMKKKKKRGRWLLCSKFRSKNREIKPAPIDEETAEKSTSSVEDETDKKKPVSVISRVTANSKNVPTGDKAVNQETKEVISLRTSQKTFHFCFLCQKVIFGQLNLVPVQQDFLFFS